MELEKFENIEFGASRPELDGTDVDNYFDAHVRPAINQKFKELSPDVQLSDEICRLQESGKTNFEELFWLMTDLFN